MLGLTAFTLAYCARDLEAATGFAFRSLAISPSFALNWSFSAWVRNWRGEHQTAVEHAQKSLRLNPLDLWTPTAHNVLAFAHYFLGRYELAADAAGESLQVRPQSATGLRIGAAALAMAGRVDQAVALRIRLQSVDPDLRLSNVSSRLGPYRRAEDIALFVEGLRRAGLPD